MNKRIGVDLDGTIADFVGLASRLLAYMFPPFTELDAWKYWCGAENDNVEDCLDFIIKNPDICRLIIPIVGAASALNVLKQNGWYICYISSRLESARMITKDWLRLHTFPNPTDLYLVDGFCKLRPVSELNLNVFVDDRVDVVTKLLDSELDKIFLMAQPYNAKDILPSRIIRVKDWREIVKELLNE